MVNCLKVTSDLLEIGTWESLSYLTIPQDLTGLSSPLNFAFLGFHSFPLRPETNQEGHFQALLSLWLPVSISVLQDPAIGLFSLYVLFLGNCILCLWFSWHTQRWMPNCYLQFSVLTCSTCSRSLTSPNSDKIWFHVIAYEPLMICPCLYFILHQGWTGMCKSILCSHTLSLSLGTCLPPLNLLQAWQNLVLKSQFQCTPLGKAFLDSQKQALALIHKKNTYAYIGMRSQGFLPLSG